MSKVVIIYLKNDFFIVLVILEQNEQGFLAKLCETIKYRHMWYSCMHIQAIRMQTVNKKTANIQTSMHMRNNSAQIVFTSHRLFFPHIFCFVFN
jgi:7-keto-8-aminopelargonate synthetase-like enzyme